MILETIHVGSMQINCYLLACSDNSSAIIIDPGDEERKIRKALEAHKLNPVLIINTHGHYDHIGCDDKFGVPVCIHKDDADFLSDPNLNLSVFFARSCKINSPIRVVEDNEIIEVAGVALKAIHIPGHTPGGMAILMQAPQSNVLFSGDSLFSGSIGRADLNGGNERLLIKFIKDKLMILPDDIIVYPGHGDSTTIGEEKRNNPFLQD